MSLYEVQCCLSGGEWFRLQVWEMESKDLSCFLHYFLKLHNSLHCEESRNMLRVRRIPYEYGLAEYEFDGQYHYKAVH